MARRGLLLILSSPSGAGKSTLARRLMDWDPTLKFSVSATTRPPRPGEVEGREGRTAFARWAGAWGLAPMWIVCLGLLALAAMAERRPN